MHEIYDFIDKYVKLSYIVRRLNAKLHKLPEFMYATSVACDYRGLGLDEGFVSKLEAESPSLHDIRGCYDVLAERVNGMSVEIYSTIYSLSPDLKEDLYDYLLAKSIKLTEEVNVIQTAYMKTVGLIEQAEQSEDTQNIRNLGKVAKVQYSKYYELDSLKNSYTYLGCYMSSMVRHNFCEDVKTGSGLSL